MRKLKKFLIGVLAAGTALGSYSCDNSVESEALRQFQERQVQVQRTENLEEKVGEGNIALREFPNEISGAKKIEKYENPESEYCLVHVRQVHPLFDGKEVDDYTLKVQGDLNEILESLSGNLKEVYCEGIDRNLADYISKMANYKSFPSELKELGEKYAPLGIALNRKIKLLPAESYELNQKHRYLEGEESENAKMNPREDYLLELISQRENPLAVTVYGAKHNWIDNIGKWNEQNPSKSFSLIEVTPESYETGERK